MQVQFRATFDDLADVTERGIKRGRRRMLWSGTWPWALVVGVFAFATAPEGRNRLAAGLLGAAVGAGAFALFCYWPMKASLRKSLRKVYGSEAPFDVMVQLDAEGVTFSQLNTRTLYKWAIVNSIEDCAESVEFYSPRMGLAVVRNRAFDSADMRTEFITLARQFHADARKSPH